MRCSPSWTRSSGVSDVDQTVEKKIEGSICQDAEEEPLRPREEFNEFMQAIGLQGMDGYDEERVMGST